MKFIEWTHSVGSRIWMLQRIPRGGFCLHEGVDQLAMLYPLCFFRAHELPRPLKIGIHNDIILTRATMLLV
jgi:hypothetical protein